MIKGLNAKGRFDLWWEIVLPLTDVKDGKKQPFWLFNPQPGEEDQFPNVEIIQVKWPSSTITTRGHFDKFSLNTAFVNKDNRNDDDTVDNPEDQFRIGVDHARAQTIDLMAQQVPGIHYYVLNKSDAAAALLDGMQTASK